MSSRGKIRVTKSVNPSDNLVDSRGMVLHKVNFEDSFIFSEVGNESLIEYDIDDQNWYFDISKIIPVTPTSDLFNIVDIKEGDTIIYDPTTSKFINSQLLSNDINRLKSDITTLDFIAKRSANSIQTIIETNDSVNNKLEYIETKLDDILNDNKLPVIESKISLLDDEIESIKRSIEDLPDDTGIENQITLLQDQISQLTTLINTQQRFISTVSSSGLPSFKYEEIDKEFPSGLVDGNNVNFTLSTIPILNTEYIYLNGILQEIDSNYTINDNLITFIEPPLPGMIIRCNYRVSTGDVITPNPKFYGVGYRDNASLHYTIIDKELVTGETDGINSVFELQNEPLEYSESIYLNGVLQERGGIGANYNIIGNVITFVEPPLPGMIIRCTYKIT